MQVPRKKTFSIILANARRKIGVNERMFSRSIFVREHEATILEQDTAIEYENSISGFSSCCHSCWGFRLPNPSVFKISEILNLASLRFAASVLSLQENTSEENA